MATQGGESVELKVSQTLSSTGRHLGNLIDLGKDGRDKGTIWGQGTGVVSPCEETRDKVEEERTW